MEALEGVGNAFSSGNFARRGAFSGLNALWGFILALGAALFKMEGAGHHAAAGEELVRVLDELGALSKRVELLAVLWQH